MSTSAQFSVKALLDKMKSLVFILSLLLILERQAAVVGQYGGIKHGFTKGGFTKGGFMSSSSRFMKGYVSYGLKGGSKDAAEQSTFLQTKQQVYSKGGNMARLSQEHTGVTGAALCRKGQISLIKSKESQVKSFGQAKSHESPVKSYGQIKSYGSPVKSHESPVKYYGQTKSHGSQVKSYGQLKSQNAQLKSYSQLKSRDAQLKSYGQRKSFDEDTQLKSYAQEKSQVAHQAFSQAKTLNGFSQQTQHKGFAMNEVLSQVGKQYDDDTSVQQKSSQQVKTEQDLSQFGQEHSQSYKGYLEQYQKKSQDHYQQKRNFNGGGYFTKGGEGLYQIQLKS